MIEMCDEEVRLSEVFLKYASNEDVKALDEICKKVKERELRSLNQIQDVNGFDRH